ncbi:MAG TPA: 30S ribosomal protein S3 [Nitrososphaeraceae archaeon]|nr:30S ribosomal protein S3 [Nitrososphaeraceae archaeon]
MNAAKNVMLNNYKNMELDSYLKETLKETGYGGVEIQKTPIGTRITLYVTRPGLVIGRKGVGIKDLTAKLESNFGLSNPQVSVMEIEVPELNPKIMANRIAQLIERGTAFRRAAMWTLNTVMNAGALGTEVTIAGKLRSERAHFEKHTSGIIPKSGNVADRVVKVGVTNVLTKMGLMGIQLKIALKNEMPSEFQLNIESKIDSDSTKETEDTSSSSSSVALSEKENREKIILTTSNQKSTNTGNESQKKEKIKPSIGSRPRKDSYSNEGKYTGYNISQRDAPRRENKTEEDVKQQENPLQESRKKKDEGVGA